MGALLLVTMVSACEQREPSGQIIAVVGDAEISFRELEQAQRSTTLRQSEALARLVERKSLVAEAERRGVETDGQFHFALREAREELLVEALRDRIARHLPQQSRSAIAYRVEAYPWRYRDRFRLGLASIEGEDDRSAWLDSAAYAKRPPQPILGARVGDVIVSGGTRWRVIARLSQSKEPVDLERAAEADLQGEAVERQLRQMIAETQQSGKVRYQKGFGPAAEN